MTQPASPALSTPARNQPDIVEGDTKEPEEGHSTPSHDEQITTKKGSKTTKLPEPPTRKALLRNNPEVETPEVVKKMKHDDYQTHQQF
nr:hypothetical protein [Tanacetum cinerariifolium]